MRTIALIFLALMAAGLCVLGYYVMPLTPVGVPQSVERARLACGDLWLTQTYTATTEPYEVSLYFRADGQADWFEYYVEHEAFYWRGGFVVDSARERASVTYYGKQAAEFSCSTKKLSFPDGRVLRAKARVADPLTRSLKRRAGPADVGAR